MQPLHFSLCVFLQSLNKTRLQNIVTTAEIDISPSIYPALTLELWVRVNSFAGTSNGWILGHDNSGESLTALLCNEEQRGI